jgi:hypothetical protein
MPLGYVIFEGFLKKPVFSLLYLFSLSPFFPFGEPGRLVRNEGHLRADELDVRERGGDSGSDSLSAFFFF